MDSTNQPCQVSVWFTCWPYGSQSNCSDPHIGVWEKGLPVCLSHSPFQNVFSAMPQMPLSPCPNSQLKPLIPPPHTPPALTVLCGAFMVSFAHVQGSGWTPMTRLFFLPCLAASSGDSCSKRMNLNLSALAPLTCTPHPPGIPFQ